MRTGLIVACMLTAPWAAAGQSGGITGTVTGDTGGVLPGVTVEATGGGLPAPRVAVTDGDGRYALAGYVVTFTLAGFERLEREVELAPGLTAMVDADLRIGGLFEGASGQLGGPVVGRRGTRAPGSKGEPSPDRRLSPAAPATRSLDSGWRT